MKHMMGLFDAQKERKRQKRKKDEEKWNKNELKMGNKKKGRK